MDNSKTLFTDVIVPLALSGVFTYRVPKEWEKDVEVGKRVVVSFGRSKLYTGIIQNIHHNIPQKYKAKYLDSILDESPIITPFYLQIWEWIANYYMCTLGEVLIAALPGGLRLTSEQRFYQYVSIDDISTDLELSEKEMLTMEGIEKVGNLSLDDISQITGLKNPYSIIKSLIQKQLIIVDEELIEKYKPKIIKTLHPDPEFFRKERFEETTDLLKNAPRQLQYFKALFDELHSESNPEKIIYKNEFQNQHGFDSVLTKALEKKGLVTIDEELADRLHKDLGDDLNQWNLSKEQQHVLGEIKQGFASGSVCLLHGVTGSGKTEIYMSLIQELLDRGGNALYLVPEIALTTQLIQRLESAFGNQVCVFHSRYSQNERVEVWQAIVDNSSKYKLFVGARSACFLPFSKLDLLIVDEEHETSYKQHDPAPRYNARDLAILMGKRMGSNIILGSATPSVESYWNVQKGKYYLVCLKQRYSGVQMPEIWIADVRKEVKKKTMHSHFSSLLLNEMTRILDSGDQVILFQNRRGFSPYIQCEVCGESVQCTRCDVSMVYHKGDNLLKCHYCGYKTVVPKLCPSCNSIGMKLMGFGTEKIEEETAIFFPDIEIGRMDLDTTRNKRSFENLIHDFQNGKTRILVGTQMVAKGLDFDKVGLVGVLNADFMLNLPDYKSGERAFQLLSQVAGRSGRRNKRGKVIIQSMNPQHNILRHVINHDYVSMYNEEVLVRRNFNYPPFVRIVKVIARHKDKIRLENTIHDCVEKLNQLLPSQVFGPQAPFIPRVRNLFIQEITIKLRKNQTLETQKNLILKTLEEGKQNLKGMRIHYDVDPV